MPRDLPIPPASAPILFGAPAPPADLLGWSWAEDRLINARNYWIATTRPDGRPHCRPVWGVWLSDGFWFSTGSLARHNLDTRPAISVNLEDGDEVVVLEGISASCTDLSDLQRMCDVYGPKYDYPLAPTEDGEVRDADGTGGPVFHVMPNVVFGWRREMTSPTRWAFASS